MSELPAVKPSYLSKTLWVNFAVAALALLWPGAAKWVQAHPEATIYALTLINVVLRFVTKGKVALI